MEKDYMVLGRKMKIDEIGLYISSIICIIGTFLPFYTITFLGTSQSTPLISGDGKYLLALCVAACACTWFYKYAFSLGISIAAIVVMVIDFTHAYNVTEGIGKYDFGGYICFICTVLMVLFTVVSYLRYKKGGVGITNKPHTFSSKETMGKENGESLIICSKCNSKYAKDHNFCPTCGEPKPKERKCGKCGTVLNDEALFCPTCGEKVQDNDKQTKIICQKCGVELKEGTIFCGNCGNKVGD